jgi:DNA primase
MNRKTLKILAEKTALQETDITSIIGSYAILGRVKNDWVGDCPFCDDCNLSFFVCAGGKKQHYHCSRCGSFGNAAQFIQNIEKCSHRKALKKLTTIYARKYHGLTYDEFVAMMSKSSY